MANPLRGETPFECEGKSYKLSFSVNALCALEDALGEGIHKITQMLSNVDELRLSSVRAVFWAGLQDHHPEITVQQAGVLMTAMGNIEAIGMISKAFALAFPEIKGPLGGRGKATGAGTGKRS